MQSIGFQMRHSHVGTAIPVQSTQDCVGGKLVKADVRLLSLGAITPLMSTLQRVSHCRGDSGEPARGICNEKMPQTGPDRTPSQR